MPSRRWLLPLLLSGHGLAREDFDARCASVDGCLDAPEDSSLHLLQQHALHMDRRTRPASKATSVQVPAAPDAPAATPNATSNATQNQTAPQVVRHRKPPVAASPTIKPPTEESVDPLGLSLNAEGDLMAFVSSLATNFATMVVCIVIFSILRIHYPLMYSGNVVKEGCSAPSRPDPKSIFSWVHATIDGDTEAWIQSVGLDNAMLLEFTRLCMRMSLIVGLPMMCILAPMHYFCGGKAAGKDHMSLTSMGNVEYNSWLYWVYPFVVWAVVLAVVHLIFQAQKTFVHWRFQWMKRIPEKSANTVIVSGISKKRQSDSALKEFFDKMFPGGSRVKSAYVVKDTGYLPSLVASWRDAKEHLREAQRVKEETGVERQRRKSIISLGKEEASRHYMLKMVELWKQIDEKRNAILEASKLCGEAGHNRANGFVTFTNRADAEIALRLDAISKDKEKWDINSPPEPKDIIWKELTEDPTTEAGSTMTGYALLVGLFVAYVPAIIALTHLAKAVDLGPLQPFWEGLAPTFGLQFMVAFLPTFIVLIFRLFFVLKAEALAQHRLQVVYFYFQVFFIILATAVGRHVTHFIQALIQSPLAIFRFLGDTLPDATHFYCNFIVMQWTAHCMNLLRYVPLSKYKGFCALYSEEEAAEKAEPEDQDYYGIGSRSARWVINMNIAIVFGTMCPPIYVLTFLNFAICRVVYGYLIPYAETRKPDTGGYLWTTSLRHVFVGLLIYGILMTGVLYDRVGSNIPSWIAASSLLYVVWAIHRYDTHFAWKKLPFKYVVDEDTREDMKQPKRELKGEYLQPELFSDYEEIKAYMKEHPMEALTAESS